jgi:hypothetical protein
MSKIDPRLAAMTLRDADDRPLLLSDLWKDGPAVVVFIRHYG